MQILYLTGMKHLLTVTEKPIHQPNFSGLNLILSRICFASFTMKGTIIPKATAMRTTSAVNLAWGSQTIAFHGLLAEGTFWLILLSNHVFYIIWFFMKHYYDYIMTRFAKKKTSSSTQNCSVCRSRPLQCTWKSTKRPSQWVWVGNLSVWLCALQAPFQPQQVVCKQNTQVYTVCRCFSFDLRTFWMRKYRV